MKRILLLLMLCMGMASFAQTNTWTGAGDGTNWSDAANWSLSAVPVAANDVVIPTGFTVTLNVAGTTKSIVVQGNSTFNITRDLSFLNASSFATNVIVNWSLGGLYGGGTLTNNGTVNTLTNNSYSINGLTIFNNAGTYNITGTGDLYINDGIFNNTGVIDMQADEGIITNSGNGSHILNNSGLIKRTTTTGNTRIYCALNNNDGTISVESGNLIFDSLDKNLTDGTYNVADGSILQWNSNTVLAGTLTGLLDGVGEIAWTSLVIVPDTTTATFDFTGSSGVSWISGGLNGGGTLVNKSLIFTPTNNNRSINEGSTLSNEGTYAITGTGDLYINDGMFNNQVAGTIDMQVDGGLITYSTNGLHVLNNSGLIKRTTSTGSTNIQCTLNNNDGTISVESGNLIFDSLDKNLTDGTYNVADGSILQWTSHIIVAGTLTGLLDGVGEIAWTSLVIVPDTTTATFDFTGSSGVSWISGGLNGGGTLVNKSLIFTATNNSRSINEGSTLSNEGTYAITGTGDLYINDGMFNNQVAGTIDMQVDGGLITYSTNGLHVLNNSGLIKRTTSTGSTNIQCILNNNDGTISVESGNLIFDSLDKNLTDGTYNVADGSILQWNSNTVLAGTLTGLLDGVGEIAWTSLVIVPDTTTATFDFTGSSGVSWISGGLNGGGTLVNKSLIFTPTNNSRSINEGSTLSNEGTYAITDTGDLYINDGIFNNQATGVIDMQVDGGNITYSGSGSHVLNNFGLLKKSMGTSSVLIYPQVTNSGTIDAMMGTLNFPDPLGLTNTVDGTIKGTATIDLPSDANFTNDGTFAPGGSPGTLTVLGNYKSSATSVLDVELNGLTQSTEYDLLAITGTNVIFDGDVNVTMGFEGDIGDAFTVATTSGTIATKNLTTPVIAVYQGKQYTFDITYPGDNSVLLTISGKLDIEPPTVLTQNITVQLDGSGNASITTGDIDNGSTDNCTIQANLLFELDTTDFTCADLGANTVSLKVTDEAGNFASADATVTVEDSINPTVVTQNVTVQLDASGNASITTNDIDNGSTDNCTIDTMSLDITDFTCADLGANTVMLTVTDESSNSASASATVTVQDTTNPTVVTQNVTVQLDASGNASITTNDIDNGSTDNCTIDTMSLDITDFTCADIGDNTVMMTVTDQSNNSASASATVTVEDLISPVVTCPGDMNVSGGTEYTLPDYYGTNVVTATDNCAVTSVDQNPAPGTQIGNGQTTVTMTAHDASGNTAVCTFNLDVTLGVDDFELSDASIVLFPNPATERFTIKNTTHISLVNATIVDLKGSVVQTIDLRNMNTDKTINIQNYASGVYFVRINSATNTIVKKMVVSK